MSDKKGAAFWADWEPRHKSWRSSDKPALQLLDFCA